MKNQKDAINYLIKFSFFFHIVYIQVLYISCYFFLNYLCRIYIKILIIFYEFILFDNNKFRNWQLIYNTAEWIEKKKSKKKKRIFF